MIRIFPRRTRNIFLQLFLVPGFLLIGITIWLFQSDADSSLKLIKKDAWLNVDKQQEIIENEFSNITSDLIFLSRQQTLGRQLLSSANQITRRDLAIDFQLFAEQKVKYEQIRYLDESGMEVVRINYREGRVEIVGENDLQSKSGRYYFKDSLRLENSEIFISPIDLNIERGEIERPLKPTVRLGTPVFDSIDKKRGIVVLNYLAGNLFKLIAKTIASTASTSLILNREGYFIKGRTVDDEWGFMLPDRKRKTMGKLYPEAWNEIQHKKRGQLTNQMGLFTFSEVVLKRFGGTGVVTKNKSDNLPQSWKIVLHTPSSILREAVWETLPRYIISDLLLLMMWAMACFFLSRSLAHKEETFRRLEEKDERIRNIINIAFDSIITINERGIIESFNPAACLLFGYQEHEMIGQKVNKLMPSPDREYHDMYLQRFIETGEGNNIMRPTVVTAQKRDGSTFPLMICIGAKKIGGNWMFTGICRDNTENRAMQKQMEELAIRDTVTGVYNREYFDKQFITMFDHAKRYKTDLSVIILDIDYFREFNEQQGYKQGDIYLAQLATLLKQLARGIDVIARYGGDEFVLILPVTDIKGALLLAECIRKEVSELKTGQQDRTIKNTISAGVASLLDSQAELCEDLILSVDQALHNAKKTGRNQCANIQSEPAHITSATADI
ncbi:MAG: diguanylate cyclase [Proteobacteria bacterium]|nr:diguanylate cyclase [Pseudomonadota bacterium]